MSSQEPSPFFCYLSYNAPHTPLQVDSQYFRPFLDQGLDERTSRAYGMVKNLDENIGRMITKLAELNLTESTIILFMSDNGPISGWQIPQEKMRYNAGLRDQKFTVYEGGIRTQCFWSWEKHWPKNRTLDVVAGHIDVLPTIADVLDIKSPDKIRWDGISLLPFIREEDKAVDRFFYQKFDLTTLGTNEPYPGAMVCKGDWKLVNGNELYHLSEDPGETQNRANGHPGKLEELKKAYENWWKTLIEETDLIRKPVSLGYPESPSTYLQPHHGLVKGNLRFEGKRGLVGEKLGFHPTGVDGDWVVNWANAGDQITWNISVVSAGIFEVGIIGSGWNTLSLDRISLILDGQPVIMTNSLDERPALDHSNISLNTMTLQEGIHELGLRVKDSLPNPNVKLESLYLKREK
jgi:arylsulfatase A